MPLELKSIEGDRGGFVARYQVTHSTPGRDGTTLAEPLTLHVRPGATLCELHIDDCQAATPDEALDRLAAWLTRLAEGIKTRSETSLQVPV